MQANRRLSIVVFISYRNSVGIKVRILDPRRIFVWCRLKIMSWRGGEGVGDGRSE